MVQTFACGSWFPISHISSFVRFVFLWLFVPFLNWLTSCRLHLLSGGFCVLLLNSMKCCVQFMKCPDSVEVICRNILEFLIQASPEHAANAVRLFQYVSDGTFCPQVNYNAASLPMQWWPDRIKDIFFPMLFFDETVNLVPPQIITLIAMVSTEHDKPWFPSRNSDDSRCWGSCVCLWFRL